MHAREVVTNAESYIIEAQQHVTFWPQQTAKRRLMTVSIGDLPGETQAFDFASTHCTMLQIDNKVRARVTRFTAIGYCYQMEKPEDF